MKPKTFLIILLLLTFFKGVIWAGIVPLWHTPDEQVHFEQVSFFAEKKRMPQGAENDASQEIIFSTKLLGTQRDEKGNNKFTFHPEYRIEYSNNLTGKYEEEINRQPMESRQKMVKQEAARYPPFYYILSAVPYQLVYEKSLISRVFAVRFLSVFIAVFTVYFSFLIAREVFPKKFFWQIIIASFVSFQPMFSFITAGITSDNLGNLLYTIIIYQCLLILNYGLDIKKIIGLGLISGLGIYTKPQFFTVFPIIIIPIFYDFFKRKKPFAWYLKLGIVFLGLIILSGGFREIQRAVGRFQETGKLAMLIPYYPFPVESWDNPSSNLTFYEHFLWTVKHTIAEVIPWYWGVFNWLGVVLPRWTNRILMRIMGLAFLGLLIRGLSIIKNRCWDKQTLNLIFLVFANFIFFLALLHWDWQYTKSHGFSLGIQGRYYFPLLSTQMLFLFYGLVSLIPDKWQKLQNLWLKILALGIIELNFTALWVVINAYYETQTLQDIIIQASQYKPIIFKGWWQVGWFGFYGLFLTVFVWQIIQIKNEKSPARHPTRPELRSCWRVAGGKIKNEN